MANFVSWSVLYTEALNALANRTWSEFWIYRCQNRMDMETTFTKLGDVTKFIEWLGKKASEEANGEIGSMQFCIGGN
jgi:hypothetical protein